MEKITNTDNNNKIETRKQIENDEGKSIEIIIEIGGGKRKRFEYTGMQITTDEEGNISAVEIGENKRRKVLDDDNETSTQINENDKVTEIESKKEKKFIDDDNETLDNKENDEEDNIKVGGFGTIYFMSDRTSFNIIEIVSRQKNGKPDVIKTDYKYGKYTFLKRVKSKNSRWIAREDKAQKNNGYRIGFTEKIDHIDDRF